MLNPYFVSDGASYRKFRADWATIYKHLSGMIRTRKDTRRLAAMVQGEADAVLAKVKKRMPNNEARIKRIERFLRKAQAHRLDWRSTNAVCLSLRQEARQMMVMLEAVKAKRPPAKKLFKADDITTREIHNAIKSDGEAPTGG